MKDRHKRVFVEQKIKDVEPLIELQREISKINPDFQPEIPEKLHMTLFHFGIPEELFEDFKKVNPILPFNKFMNGFDKLLQESDDAAVQDMQVKAENLDVFGSFPNHAVVLRLVKSPEIMHAREKISKALSKFIHYSGISDVSQFMLQSPNLQFELDDIYKPHITLGYIKKNIKLPEKNVSDLIVHLKSSDVANVEKLSN